MMTMRVAAGDSIRSTVVALVVTTLGIAEPFSGAGHGIAAGVHGVGIGICFRFVRVGTIRIHGTAGMVAGADITGVVLTRRLLVNSSVGIGVSGSREIVGITRGTELSATDRVICVVEATGVVVRRVGCVVLTTELVLITSRSSCR